MLALGVQNEDYSNNTESPINYAEPRRGPGDFPLKLTPRKSSLKPEHLDDSK
jgi:hypothetical protein